MIKYEEPKTVSESYEKYRRVNVFINPIEFISKLTECQEEVKLLTIVRYAKLYEILNMKIYFFNSSPSRLKTNTKPIRTARGYRLNSFPN